MKKYFVCDGENDYEVTEVEETEQPAPTAETKDDASELTADEITALKSLAAAAPKIMAMIEKTETTDEDEDEEGLETCDADPEEDIDEKEETIIETEKKPTHDSKRSFGANEKKQTVDDSVEDEISVAWAKRYGGR